MKIITKLAVAKSTATTKDKYNRQHISFRNLSIKGHESHTSLTGQFANLPPSVLMRTELSASCT